MSQIIMHTDSMEQIRPLNDDEKYGAWAAKYFGQGHHRRQARITSARSETDGCPQHEPKDQSPAAQLA